MGVEKKYFKDIFQTHATHQRLLRYTQKTFSFPPDLGPYKTLIDKVISLMLWRSARRNLRFIMIVGRFDNLVQDLVDDCISGKSVFFFCICRVFKKDMLAVRYTQF